MGEITGLEEPRSVADNVAKAHCVADGLDRVLALIDSTLTGGGVSDPQANKPPPSAGLAWDAQNLTGKLERLLNEAEHIHKRIHATPAVQDYDGHG